LEVTQNLRGRWNRRGRRDLAPGAPRRKAADIRRALDPELSICAQIFGFELPRAEGIEQIEIH